MLGYGETLTNIIIIILILFFVILGVRCAVFLIKEYYSDGECSLPLLLYMAVMIFSFAVFLYAAGRTEIYGNKWQFEILVIGQMLILYGSVSIKRSVGAVKRIQMEEDIKALYGSMDEWKQCCSRIRDYKQSISYMRHDMANHMQVINSLMLSEKQSGDENIDGGDSRRLQEEMEKIRQLLKSTAQIKYCDNDTLNIAIEQKIRSFSRQQIKTETDIRLTGIADIECEELCVIIWLLADNVTRLFEGREGCIFIKLYNRGDVHTGGCGIAYRIEGRDLGLYGSPKRRANAHRANAHRAYARRASIQRENAQRALVQRALAQRAIALEKSPEMYIAKSLIKRLNGSIAVEAEENRVIQAGMLELKK